MKKRYKEITLPVLTMHGDDDDVSPVEGSEQLHQNMAGGDLQEIKVVTAELLFYLYLAGIFLG